MPAFLDSIELVWLRGAAVVVLAVLAALALHGGAHFVLRKTAARTATPTDDLLLRRLSRPSRWILIVLAVAAVQPALALPNEAATIWRRVAGLLVPALIGWLAAALLRAIHDIVLARSDISIPDNLRARRRRTRAGILYRIGLFLVLLITFCMMLMTIPSVRNIGVTLVASAGVAGLAVGAAAQPALKNLIAGIQMAFTEPIRIDDVVIIDGEWGRIEEIRLTYVVMRLWDERRLIVPVSKFLEQSFQNWTRTTSRILGTAFLHVDPSADVPRIRAKLREVVGANSRWDGRVVGLQVTEAFPDHLQLRALVSAANAGDAFDLRCDVREALAAFVASEMPEALVRQRSELLGENGREAAAAALDAE